MATITELKQQETPDTPILLFSCTLSDGTSKYWSTHRLRFEGNDHEPRILKHNLFEIRSSADEAVDGAAKVAITLSNVDTELTQVERNTGWKGAKLTVRFVFFDLAAGAATSESLVLFRGTANAPDEIAESTMRLSFASRFNLQRVALPELRIQKRCPWAFPADGDQRLEARDGGTRGKYSNLWRCGYSADLDGGCGNLSGTAPFASCDYSRSQCVERGMFDHDSQRRTTSRFGGVEFVPSTILVRTYGDKGSHSSAVIDNLARYNDVVPLVYGTVWYEPPLVFARNDGNLTHMEVLLGAGEIHGVLKVVVNNYEIPAGRSGANMTGTGWYNMITAGQRNGSASLDFTSGGQPLGDPYGSMAALSVVVPNRVNDGQSTPKVQVLLEGLKLPRYDSGGNHVDEAFTNNPAWVLLDMLRRSGWSADEISLPSFASAAAYCDTPIQVQDANGTAVQVAKYQCNIVFSKRRSAGDLIRGVRNGSSLYLTYGPDAKLELHAESSIDVQQPAKPSGSNAAAPLAGGWPAYEFGDGTANRGGIVRRPDGSTTLRLWSKSTADTPNRISIEFQDSLNGYQQDSLSLVDAEDAQKTGQEGSATLTALGIPTFDQAARVSRLQLLKSIHGNTFAEFETSVRGIDLKPGDLITLTYQRAGLDRQLFRVLSVAPALNARTMKITCQIHDNSWYGGASGASSSSGVQPWFDVGVPRPLRGAILGASGVCTYSVQESTVQATDGSVAARLSVGFSVPAKPASSNSAAPLVSLTPIIDNSGGTLAGGLTYYYGVSALDANGAESGLSFLVAAAVPGTTNTNSVSVEGLSFAKTAQTFHIYRGLDPQRLSRISHDRPLATTFTDTGLPEAVAGPPDRNFDHASFYWRFEVQPPISVNVHSPATVGNDTLQMPANQYAGSIAILVSGRGAGQERLISSNTATALTVTPGWAVEPDSTTTFAIAESGWTLGASGSSSPLTFDIPNRSGVTVQVQGRSVNAFGIECASELSLTTRWQIRGADGSGLQGDGDVPPAPDFALTAPGRGQIEIGAIGFPSLTNTTTISAGTLALYYYDELQAGTVVSLAQPMAASDTVVLVGGGSGLSTGDNLQIESEIVTITSVDSGGYVVTRGVLGTSQVAHPATTRVLPLGKRSVVLSFPRGFFGSPAGGNYLFSMDMPSARIAAAELSMTNSQGNSPWTHNVYTGTRDGGVRTLSGGQISIQVEGPLAVQTDATPPFPIGAARAIRDIFATVGRAPSASPVVVRVRQDSDTICELTIPPGAANSPSVSGVGLSPLRAMAQLNLDIVSVGSTADEEPGRDLTVTVRL